MHKSIGINERFVQQNWYEVLLKICILVIGSMQKYNLVLALMPKHKIGCSIIDAKTQINNMINY